MDIYNILHAAYNEEIRDIRDSARNEMSASVKFLYDDGSLVIPVNENMLDKRIFSNWKGETVTRDNNENFSAYRGEYAMDTSSFHDRIARTHSLQRIDGLDAKALLNIAIYFVEHGKGDFYGIMVQDGERRYNILHPVVAIMLISGHITLGNNMSAVPFRYPEKVTIDEENSAKYQGELRELTSEILTKKELPSLSLEARHSLNDDISAFASSPHHSIRFRERSSNSNYVFTPVQFATAGLTIPWYALIFSQKRGGGGFSSANIYPILSGNVSSLYLDSAGSTCTGNHDSSMFSSLYVLNNMNIGSMYFGNCVPIDNADFIDACQNVSIEALKLLEKGL